MCPQEIHSTQPCNTHTQPRSLRRARHKQALSPFGSALLRKGPEGRDLNSKDSATVNTVEGGPPRWEGPCQENQIQAHALTQHSSCHRLGNKGSPAHHDHHDESQPTPAGPQRQGSGPAACCGQHRGQRQAEHAQGEDSTLQRHVVSPEPTETCTPHHRGTRGEPTLEGASRGVFERGKQQGRGPGGQTPEQQRAPLHSSVQGDQTTAGGKPVQAARTPSAI